MKVLKLPILFLALAGASFAAFNIPTSTLDGGGGRSSGTGAGGKVFTVTGTIGQFDATAGSSSGGKFGLNGGFWAQVVEGALPDYPDLTIIRQPNGDASLQWGSDAAGWRVETSTDLVHWTVMGGTITTGGVLTVSPSPSVPKAFFRLRYP